MLCKQCGFNLSNQANFCPSCGNKITDEERQQNSSPKQSAKWLKILLGILIAGLTLITLLILLSEDMTDIVSEQLKSIKENRLTEAYYDYTSKSFQEATSLDRFREFMNIYPAFAHNKSVRFIDRTTENDSGSLHAMILTEQGVEIPVQYSLVREGDKWKIESIKLEDIGSQGASIDDGEQAAIVAPIELQLQALQKREVRQGYDTLSKQYSEKMPWDQFDSFVKGHPIFFQYKSVNYEAIQRSGDKATVNARLESRKDQVVVSYELVQEEGKWKIAGMQLQGNESAKEVDQAKKDEVFDSKPLETVIKAQMEQIRQKNFMKAYEDYTSKDFQKSTTIKEFEGFIKDNTSFSENSSVELDDISFDNNVATMAGILKSRDGKVYPVEYDLVQENGVWKIFHVQVLNPDQRVKKAASDLQFSKFVLGSGLGNDGLVVSSKTTFKTNSGDIYLNLYVDNVKSDTKIQVVFEHVDSHSTIEPVSSRVSEDGNVILTFIFSPPTNGWPKGKYRLSASASTGETGTFDFVVEE